MLVLSGCFLPEKGKPNKIIADELNMSESAVKVYVGNLMKKMKAKNRTDRAFSIRILRRRDSWRILVG